MNTTLYKIKSKLNKLLFFSSKKKRRFNKTMLEKALINDIEKQYKNDYIFFSRNGIGDVFFVASLLHEFKKKNPGKIIYLTEKRSITKFLKAFDSIDKIVYNENFQFQHIVTLQKKIQTGQITFLFFPYRGTKSNYVFADSYANMLDLPLNTIHKLPTITTDNEQNAHKEFQRLNIRPEKTIILIPDSVMFDYRVLTKNFWLKLANKLTQKGYDVVFNTNKKFANYKTTYLPVMDFIAFTKHIKHIISFRSGINDLLVAMNITNLSAIYPKNLEVIWADKFLFDELLNKYHQKLFENEFDNIFHIYSLNSNFKRNDIDEIIFNGSEEDLIEHFIDIK